MITKYTTGGLYKEAKIGTMLVLRETEQSVFVPSSRRGETERREGKCTEWRVIFDTWDAAHAALTAHADQRISNARRTLELAHAFAGNVKGMKKPEEQAGSPAEQETR